MTRQEFVKKYQDELAGAVMDVLFRDSKGGEMALLVRQLMRKIDATLATAFDELTREKAAPTNGNGLPRIAK